MDIINHRVSREGPWLLKPNVYVQVRLKILLRTKENVLMASLKRHEVKEIIKNMRTEFRQMFSHSLSRINYTRQNSSISRYVPFIFISEELLCAFISFLRRFHFHFYYISLL